LRVNALHHQAVKDPGKGIAIVAREANQVVQAIETAGEQFVIGVQWHPEYLPQHPEHRRLFRALVQHARQVQSQIEAADMQQALSLPPQRSVGTFGSPGGKQIKEGPDQYFQD
jgi:putative glutamine amidotransferase